jgi:hypothetical protein
LLFSLVGWLVALFLSLVVSLVVDSGSVAK